MPPLSMMIKPVSGRCNMRCTYCFYADEMSKRETALFETMTDATLETLVRRAFAYAQGQVTFAFQGGEPTLAGAAFYGKLLALEKKYNARGLNVHHAIQSNGYAITDDMMDVLKDGQFLVGLSIDGTKAIHDSRRKDARGEGTYDRVLDTAKRLWERQIEYNVLCVVDRDIAMQPEAVFDALAPHRFLQFIPCLDPLGGEGGEYSLTAERFGQFLIKTFDRYEARFRMGDPVSVRAFDNWIMMLKGYPPENCGFLGRCVPNYLVESNGNVYPCDFYALDEWLMGNVNADSFYKLAKSDIQAAFVSRSLEKNEDCAACPYLSICHGGCCRDRDTGHAIGKNHLCEGYRMFFETCLDRMTTLAKSIK